MALLQSVSDTPFPFLILNDASVVCAESRGVNLLPPAEHVTELPKFAAETQTHSRLQLPVLNSRHKCSLRLQINQRGSILSVVMAMPFLNSRLSADRNVNREVVKLQLRIGAENPVQVIC